MGFFNSKPDWMKTDDEIKGTRDKKYEFTQKVEARIKQMSDVSTLMEIAKASPVFSFRREAIFRLDILKEQIEVKARLEFFKSILQNDNRKEIKEIANLRILHITQESEKKDLLDKFGHCSEDELCRLYQSGEDKGLTDYLWSKANATCTAIVKSRGGKVIHEQWWESGAGKTYTYKTNSRVFCFHCGDFLPHDIKYDVSVYNGGLVAELAYTGIDTICNQCKNERRVPYSG